MTYAPRAFQALKHARKSYKTHISIILIRKIAKTQHVAQKVRTVGTFEGFSVDDRGGGLAGGLGGRLVGWPAGWLVGWRGGRLASWPAGWLAGWLAGRRESADR